MPLRTGCLRLQCQVQWQNQQRLPGQRLPRMLETFLQRSPRRCPRLNPRPRACRVIGRRRVSLTNQAFTAQQQEALRSVDEHIGAVRLGLKDAAIIFAKGLGGKKFLLILKHESLNTQ